MSNDVEELKKKAPVSKAYNQGDTLPTTGLVGVGLNIYNQDNTNELIITLLTDTDPLDIEVPPGASWSDFTIPFKGMTKSGSSVSYKVQVREST